MNGDIEELLREGVDRFTADVPVPADLVARARTRVRQRRIATRAALACGTAAATAAAVIAATGGPGPGGGAMQARTTAYVVSRVEEALASQHPVLRGARLAAAGDRAPHGRMVPGTGSRNSPAAAAATPCPTGPAPTGANLSPTSLKAPPWSARSSPASTSPTSTASGA